MQYSGKNRTGRTIRLIIMIVVSVITIYPLLWMLASSFKFETDIFKNMNLMPNPATLENYIKGWRGASGQNFGVYFKNSFIIIFFVVLGNMTSSSLTAFAFARMDFTFKKILFAVMLVTMMLPFHVTLIPRYIMFNNMGWIDTYYPLTVPAFFATHGFFIFLNVQFMRGIPKELDYAATVDGCGPIMLYSTVILPLSLPALASTAIFSFIWTWNDFFSQLIYISDPLKYTISLGLRSFMDATTRSAYGQIFAMSLLSLVPILIFFITCQRYLIEGIVTTGIKG